MENIELIIIKYLNNEAHIDELRTLDLWLKNEKNLELFNRYVKTEYLVAHVLEKFNVDEAKYTIRQKLKSNRRKWFFKVSGGIVAAVTVLGLIAIPVFNKAKLNPANTTPIAKDINVPGGNTAILTLNNGEEIRLTDGKKHDSNTYLSNGEEIIYKNNTNTESSTYYNTLTVPKGGQYVVTLSDGSKIWLNSDSKIKYPVKFPVNTERAVELLYGEVYLEVSPSIANNGTKFVVKSKMQAIEVLGTKFNIKAYKEDTFTITTLMEGSVAITTENNRAILSPNYQAKTHGNKNSIEITKANVSEAIAWKNGIFSFSNMPLKDIMLTLSRWYDIDVVFANADIKTIKFTGVLGKDQSLQDILSIITNSNKIAYEIKNGTVVLK